MVHPMDRLEIARRVWGGIFVFGICAAFGLRLLYRGLRGDVLDASGMPTAGRAWFICGGVVMLLPLVVFMIYLWRQGYLTH